MNIFVLDYFPVKAAQMQCDKHVVKMVLESAQMLSTAHQILDGPNDWAYKATHKNHPCNIWARESVANYMWLLDHFSALCKEYQHRYGKVHLCETKLLEKLSKAPENLIEGELTPFKLAMGAHPELIDETDPVNSYRRYYQTKQDNFKMVWTNRSMPSWFKMKAFNES